MQEDYWKKTLSDGSVELGRDSDINRGLASWTRGRQDIVSAIVQLDGKGVEVCSQNISLSCWEQYDNFSFSPATGITTRLSRELRCSFKNRPRLHRAKFDSTNGDDVTMFWLNTNFGDLAPEGTNTLVCRISRDGTVDTIWR